MRVALVCTSVNGLGGKNTHMANLSKYISNDEAFQVFLIFCSKIEEELLAFLIQRGLKKENCIFLSRFKKWLIIPFILELRKLFLKNKIDIVHTFQMQSDILGAAAARTAGVKFIFSMFESRIIEDNVSIIKQFFYKLGNAIVKNWFIKTVVISQGLKQDLISGNFRPKDKIEVIHPGHIFSDSYKFYKPMFNNLEQKKPLIGTVGRLSKEKGISRFIAAMPFILEKVPQARFIIVGGGKEEKSLRSQAAKLNLESKIIFTGWANDITKFLKEIDIFVLPSVREGFGFVILEAFMLFKPVVASDIEGVKDIIDDDENGLLADASSPRLFADKILYLCDNPQKAISLGEKGHTKVTAEFTMDNEIAKLKQLYLKAWA